MDFEKCVQNEQLFSEIVNEFPEISDLSIYRTHVKIAAQKYADWLNATAAKIAIPFTPVSNGKTIPKSESFVVFRNWQFYPNKKLIEKSIKHATKTGVMRRFSFFYMEITLEALRAELQRRKS